MEKPQELLKPKKKKIRNRVAGGQEKKRDLKEKFAAAYWVKPVAHQAGLKAGMPESTAKSAAYALVNDKEVQQLLAEKRAEFNEKCKADVKWKVGKLIKCIESCVPEEGNPRGYKYMGVAIKAISELNKMQGHYAPIKSISASFTVEMKNEIKSLVKMYDKEY